MPKHEKIAGVAAAAATALAVSHHTVAALALEAGIIAHYVGRAAWRRLTRRDDAPMTADMRRLAALRPGRTPGDGGSAA